MSSKDKLESLIHYSLSFIGGYMGIYALMVRSNNFGSSQTSNLIYIISNLLGNDIKAVTIRIGAALLYMSAIFLTVWIPKHYKFSIKFLSLFIDFAAVTILGFLPLDMDPILGLYPIFFATAFQWNSFSGARGYVSATIFSTNNLRQFTMALTEVSTGNKAQIDKLKFYGATLLSFQSGVAVSYILWSYLSINGIWLCYLPIACSFALVALDVKAFGDTKINYHFLFNHKKAA